MRIGFGRSWSAAIFVLLAGCGGSSGGSGSGAGGDSAGSAGSLGSGGSAGQSDSSTGGGGTRTDSGLAGSIIGTADTGTGVCIPPTCSALGANCGMVTDRQCGGVIDCSANACPAGQFCGGAGPNACGTGISGGDAGVDGAGLCTPLTCAQLGANCGPVSDGCGNLLQCGSCEGGASCGVGGTPNVCAVGSADGGGVCTPRTCAAQALACGPAGDGCGNTLNCGTCTAPATCGGGGTPGACGAPSCQPMTCASQQVACGPAGDGCGNTLSCGTCGAPKTCGGGGAPGQCGCTGVCSQIVTCSGTATTTLSGKVYDPAGVNPLYHALVYVPNDPTDPALHSFAAGITCDQCGASAAGKPLVTTYSGTDGSFTLTNVPVGATIPLVIQLGRWRRIFTVNVSNSCVANTVADHTLKMPSDHTEGDIPLMAMVTGNVDEIECVLRKMGIKDSEFTNPDGGGRIHFYLGTDGQDRTTVATGTANVRCNRNSDCVSNNCNNNTCTCSGNNTCDVNAGQTCSSNTNGRCTVQTFDYYSGSYKGTTPKQGNLFQIVNGVPVINQYDMTILACEGVGLPRTAADLTTLRNYANGGGRVFASHYSYTWLENNGDYAGTANWSHDENDRAASATGTIDLVSNPKGPAFQAWLEASGASTVGSGTVPVVVVRHDTNGIIAPTQQWIYRAGTGTYANTNLPLHFTFNTPPTAASGGQCGRVLFSDFHVIDASNNHDTVFPTECSTGAMTAQEKLLEFMIFDLGACVTPYTPVCTPRTCAEQGVSCGPAGDGCGGALACGTCPTGQTCGGGGPGKCGAPQCTPRTCNDQGIQCGPAGDGCGNAISCGVCPAGQTCGGGGRAGVCGNQICTPLTCAGQGIECGAAGDGCGNAINCGVCPAGLVCGAAGPGKCGPPACTPETCAIQGIECGPAGDGCGNLLDCGICPTGDTCGYSAPGKCGHSVIN